MRGRLLSFCEGNFSGASLNFRVIVPINHHLQTVGSVCRIVTVLCTDLKRCTPEQWGNNQWEKRHTWKWHSGLIQYHLFSAFKRVNDWKRFRFFREVQYGKCLFENISRGKWEHALSVGPKFSNEVYWPITSALIEQSMTIESHVLSIFSTPIDNSIESLKMVCAETILCP